MKKRKEVQRTRAIHKVIKELPGCMLLKRKSETTLSSKPTPLEIYDVCVCVPMGRIETVSSKLRGETISAANIVCTHE